MIKVPGFSKKIRCGRKNNLNVSPEANPAQGAVV
jgi:hypothetical protein